MYRLIIHKQIQISNKQIAVIQCENFQLSVHQLMLSVCGHKIYECVDLRMSEKNR